MRILAIGAHIDDFELGARRMSRVLYESAEVKDISDKLG